MRKHDEVEKTTDRGEAKELFSVQMHRVVTAVCTHARTRCGILLISYSFLLFAPHDRPCSLTLARGKFLWFYQDAAIMLRRM